MKRTLFLALALASCFSAADAATYTNLTQSWCDEENNVIYDGKGYFAVKSAANTSIDLTINMSSLVSYVNSNDYKSGGYMLLWDDNAADYGLADNADTSVDNGSRTPYLSGYWDGGAWNASSNNITYATLNQYAVNGSVTLKITNVSQRDSTGVTVKVTGSDGKDVQLYQAPTLLTTNNNVTNGYYVNLNYVTAVTLNTSSTLDTDTYVPPVDYSEPFVSARTDGTTVGRVTFLGDSITHGVNDQSYRWQLFKTLTDNGIENEIVGPRDGYYNSPGHTEDAGSSYGGVEFANVHLAQASGRTHNIISGSTSASVDGKNYSSGVNYGGHSTASTAEAYDSNTWFCMMGTNDLLSDTPNSGPTTAQYSDQMQKMLGGSVSYDAGSDKYTWSAGSSWGSMATIVNDVCKDGDTFYMLSITPWGSHSNHNRDMDHYAGAEFNRNLKAWCESYSQATGKNVVYVDVTRGMVDVTHNNRFMGHDGFFNNSGDRLHPNDQGSLIMAGNLAQAMGIGGRTAGLERADYATAGTSWSAAESLIALSSGQSELVAADVFTMENGYTVDFSAVFGDGAENGWAAASAAGLSITIGDGTNSGTLSLSEGYIMWGDDVLFCQDNSQTGNDGLRVAWHNGSAAENVLKGYYVWLGDMLIGQGLDATSGTGLNGVMLTAAGGEALISGLMYTNTAYAPTTSGSYSAEYAYRTTQDAAAVSGFVSMFSSGVDFSDATSGKAEGQALVSNTAPESVNFKLDDNGNSYVFLSSSAYAGEVNAQVTAETKYTIFGTKGGASNGVLTVQVDSGAKVNTGNGNYSDSGVTYYAAIAGSFSGGNAEEFNVYVNAGEVNGNIVGGTINGNGKIKTTSIIVNGGTVSGDIVAGSLITRSAATVDSGSVVVTGGKISGNITKGNAASASVTVLGNSADIGGNIDADKVALRNVAESGNVAGFDQYDGVIKTDALVLDNVFMKKASIKGLTQSAAMDSLSVLNGSDVELNAGDVMSVKQLELGGGTSLGLFLHAENHMVSTTTETSLIVTDTLLVSGAGATLNANLVMSEGATLDLSGNSLQLGSSLTLGGVQLDDVTLSNVLALEMGSSATLFTGVDELILSGKSYTDALNCAASLAFSNSELLDNYRLVYSGAESGLLGIMAVPEPTTVTLSLLALVGLAARRRRK